MGENKKKTAEKSTSSIESFFSRIKAQKKEIKLNDSEHDQIEVIQRPEQLESGKMVDIVEEELSEKENSNERKDRGAEEQRVSTQYEENIKENDKEENKENKEEKEVTEEKHKKNKMKK